MATTTSRAVRVMTEADKRLQDAGFDGPQSRAVILSAAEIVDEAIREAVAARKEAAAARKEAAAAREATKGLAGELDRFRDRTTAEMALGFARMSRQLWIMAVGAVGATAIITFGIVNLLR